MCCGIKAIMKVLHFGTLDTTADGPFLRQSMRLSDILYRNITHNNHSKNSMDHPTRQTIDNYRLTSHEEPSDEVLAQLIHEAIEEAVRDNNEATRLFFMQIKNEAEKIKESEDGGEKS
mgnify:CR=1 FL=1